MLKDLISNLYFLIPDGEFFISCKHIVIDQLVHKSGNSLRFKNYRSTMTKT